MRQNSFYGVCLLLLMPLLLGACASLPDAYEKPGETIKAEMGEARRQADMAVASSDMEDALDQPLRLNIPDLAKEAIEPRFDLVVHDADVRDVYLSMVADTRYSMLLPNDLNGRVTVSLKAVTVPEALSALRELYGYEYRLDGSRIYIQSQALQTRIMKVNYLNAVRRGSSDIRVMSGSVGDATSSNRNSTGTQSSSGSSNSSSDTAQNGFVTSRISTTAENNFWKELSQTLEIILGGREGRSAVVNPLSGVVVVRATSSEIGQVEAYLRASQLALERQVVIEAKIIEVSLNNNFQAGINWAAFPGKKLSLGQLTGGSIFNKDGTISTSPIASGAVGNLGNISEAAGAMFGMVLRISNFSAVLNMLEEQGKVHVLSSPRIATLNNQKAVLKVGSDDFFVTEVSSNSTTNSSGNSSYSPQLTLQAFFSGISLDVIPQIDDEDQVTLHIHPMVSKVSTVTQEIDLGILGNFKLPLASSQISEMDSVVKARSGQLVALGGLIREGVSNGNNQVPVLGSLPLLGNLFKQKSQEVERRELVILIKPTVIQSSADWAEDIGRSEAQVRRLIDTDNTSYVGSARSGQGSKKQ